MKRQAIANQIIMVITIIAGTYMTYACSEKQSKENLKLDLGIDLSTEENACAFDDNETFQTASDLAQVEPNAPQRTETAYLCPVADQDWYRFDQDKEILTISLKSTSQITPIQPVVEIWSIFQNPAVPDALDQVLVDPSFTSKFNLEQRYCLPKKPLALRVYDLGNDGQDKRNAYTITTTSYAEVDLNEKEKRDQVIWENGQASEFSIRLLEKSNSPETMTLQKAYISCIGDEDWFKVELSQQQILHWRLKMQESLVLPVIKLWASNGDLITEHKATRGMGGDLFLEKSFSIEQSGTYYISVADLEGLYSSLDIFYEFGIWVEQEPDLNEPNDFPNQATSVSQMPLTCTDDWSDWQLLKGFISSVGDQDWFKIDLAQCEKGLVEIEATLLNEGLEPQQSYTLQKELNLEMAVVKNHLQSDCSQDQDCRELNLSCDDLWDCAGASSTCLASGKCAGAGICLSNQKCAGIQLQRHYDLPPEATALALPPHKVKTAFPLFSNDSFYVRLGDFASNSASSKANYEFKIRVRKEKDTHEPSNRYTDQVRATDPLAPNLEKGRQQLVSVFDCSDNQPPPDGQTAGSANGLQMGCCMDQMNEWTEGYLSYESDVDFYAYEHPCPNGDCMVKIHYQIDEGSVDMLWQVYLDSGLWFDPIVPVSELPQGASITGSFGGIESMDQCFYAWQGHMGSPYYYYLSIRDFGDKKDWSSTQKYRFCIEKVADGCYEPPCKYTAPMENITKSGCGVR
jgi:hypothetical protein